MFAQAYSGAVIGVDAQPVTVECHRANGLPGLALIGLARGAVKESVVRVRSAITATEIHLSTSRLVCNLLPAELPKDAAALDLAMAVALLAVNTTVPLEALQGRRFFGELSLGGRVESVRGAVLVADLARRCGDHELLVPAANAREAAIIPGIRVIGVAHLGELVAHLLGKRVIAPADPGAPPPGDALLGCLSEVRGQAQAKRGLEVAAAGGHNMLMMGPPGSGKTMLARRLAGIMPGLTPDESIEVTRIHSAAGVAIQNTLARQRPFRAPHHTASEVALCGGGSMPRPGEVTLAHRGVLFLDELPEFSRRALESLREPLEEGFIQISRASMSLRFPADVLLIAALNPCPCGYYTPPPAAPAPLQGEALLQDLTGGAQVPVQPKARGGVPTSRTGRICLCAFEQIQRYRARISGPLLDRIDLHVAVHAVPYRELMRAGSGDSSAQVRHRVAAARARQNARFGAARTNAQMTQAELRQHVSVPPAALRIIEAAMEDFGLSSRAVGRILKVARTLADLDDTADVSAMHIEQAVDFRLLDRSPAPLHAPGSGAVHL